MDLESQLEDHRCAAAALAASQEEEIVRCCSTSRPLVWGSLEQAVCRPSVDRLVGVLPSGGITVPFVNLNFSSC